MAQRVCLDVGPISLYYQKNPPKEINSLIKKIENKIISEFLPNVIVVEVDKHLCVASGKDYAASCIRSFQHNIKVQYISLTPELILKAGELKCQYPNKLSYNDCIVIAVALKYNAELHTTERNLPKIPYLRIKPYEF